MSDLINKYMETQPQGNFISLVIGSMNRLLVDKGIATKEELFTYLEDEIKIELESASDSEKEE